MKLNTQFISQTVALSGGWLPMNPLTTPLSLGDFGQLRQGKLQTLGNMLQLALVQPVKASEPQSLGQSWCWHQGIVPQYRGIASELHNEGENARTWQKQVLGFTHPGSFSFHGREPVAQWLLNWAEFVPDITLKLTQSTYNFREVIVVTAVAYVTQWGLVIAENSEAELAVYSEKTSDWSGLSHESAHIAQSRGLSEAALGCCQPGYFFKAKKLVLTQQKYDQLMQQLLSQSEPPSPEQLNHWLSGGLINRLQPHELNLNTCLDTFSWADVTLADVTL